MGFDHNTGTAVSCTCQIHSKHPEEYQARPESYCPFLSEGSRSHGGYIHGNTFCILLCGLDPGFLPGSGEVIFSIGP